MHTLLYYLSEVAGIDPAIISDGFYAETDLLPQEYHFERVERAFEITLQIGRPAIPVDLII